MLIEIKVPQLSESVAEATLLAWHKKVGEAVKRDENLIDIETDKVVLELPAPADGVLANIIKGDGSTVKADEVIATLDTEGKASAAAPAAVQAQAKAAPAPAPAAKPAPSSAPAMPSARKLAEEKGIDTAAVAGSGRGGRVTKGDVLGATSPPATEAPAAVKPSLPQPPVPVSVEQILGNRPEQRVPMSRLRARIAERLVQSQSTAAILTTFNEVNVYHGYFDIGVAVGSPRGLVVPILRDADQMSFSEVEKKIADFGKRAQDGKLTIEELTGGTFSISNGGVFGSMLSTPIINPPQSAILGVHATRDRPVAENGQVVIRPVNYLALSYDHRIVDGREAVLSLVAIKEALEDPARLLLDL